MRDKLYKQDRSPICESANINYAWDYKKDIILTCFDTVAPVIKKRICGKPSPWLTDEIKKAMNNRDMLLHKFRKTKSKSDVLAYKNK